MCSLQIYVLFVFMRVEIYLLLYSGILWRVFACNIYVCYFVAYGLWQEFVCVVYPAYWYVFLGCLVKYVGECLRHVCLSVAVLRSVACVNLSQSAFL